MVTSYRVLLGVAVAVALALVFVMLATAPQPQLAEPVQASVSASVINARHEMPEEFLVRERAGRTPTTITMDIVPSPNLAQPIGTISGGTCVSGGVEFSTYTIQVGAHVFSAVEIPQVFASGEPGRYIEIREEGTIGADCYVVGGSFVGSIQRKYSTYLFTDVRDNKVAISELDRGGVLRISDWSRNATFDPIYMIAQMYLRKTNSGQHEWVIKQRYNSGNWLPAIHLAITAADKTFTAHPPL